MWPVERKYTREITCIRINTMADHEVSRRVANLIEGREIEALSVGGDRIVVVTRKLVEETEP